MAKSPRKLILITGCTRGLGQSMAARFIEAGHQVAGCGRTEEAVAALSKRFGPTHDFSKVDIADDAQVGRWAAHVFRNFGAPDLLLNNAAIINRNAPLWEVPAEDFSRVIDVNIKGVANVIRHFVPDMVARQSGVIVNFSSGWGRSTSPDVATYCASKWAIEGLTQALAQELPAGMAAIALNPGIINTDMLQSCFGTGASNYPTAEEWSRSAVPFLLTLGPEHNGQPLTVPGQD